MNDYLQRVNSAPFYGIVAGVLGFITIMCFVFLMKSYRAGLRIGMDKRVLKKTILSSATFTLLPSISILSYRSRNSFVNSLPIWQIHA